MPENPRIEELRRRVQADPASIAFAALAEEFRRTGRFEDAIDTCRTGLQRHPAYLSARVTLGRALLETGDYDGARAELQTVLQSAPENLAAIRGLEQIAERLGHSTEMHPDLRAIVREPIRLAAEKQAAPPAPPELSLELALTPEPAAPRPELSLDAFDLSLSTPPPAPGPGVDEPKLDAPLDIFAAALDTAAPPPPPPTLTFEMPATIAFEAPASAPPAPTPSDESVPPDGPDPHVAAALARLERFLGAIEAARHA